MNDDDYRIAMAEGRAQDRQNAADARRSSRMSAAIAKMEERQARATSSWEIDAAIHEFVGARDLIDADYQAEKRQILDQFIRESGYPQRG
jgi:hypothetical protein